MFILNNTHIGMVGNYYGSFRRYSYYSLTVQYGHGYVVEEFTTEMLKHIKRGDPKRKQDKEYFKQSKIDK